MLHLHLLLRATWATAAVVVTFLAVLLTLVVAEHGELVVDLAAVDSAASVVCLAVRLQAAVVQLLA